MRQAWLLLTLAMALLLWTAAGAAERFPPPDFTDHQLPQTQVPHAAPLWQEYLDVAVLAGALGLAAYLALRRRSRAGLFALAVGAILWFGFWRQGCICPIGAIQNVALAVFDSSYTIPLSVVLIFALPIAAALFFGRVFCASVCPLGAVQEMVALRPIRVPAWIDHSLGLLPFVYLGGAVIVAALGGRFLICEYDPFVGFFRLSAPITMLVLGGCFLVVGLFVGRPYCRYLCPLGAILGLCSRVSQRHVRIPPNECVNCRLCEDVCPYGAIEAPSAESSPAQRPRARLRLAGMLALAPVLVLVCGLLGYELAAPLSKTHLTVQLAEYVRDAELNPPDSSLTEQELAQWRLQSPAWKARMDAVEGFRNTGRPAAELYQEALDLRKRFAWGGSLFGGWVGLVIGAKLIYLSMRRRREEYQPDRANCVSCGRCFWYCPQEQVRLGLIETIPVASREPPAKTNGDAASQPRETAAV